MTAWEDEFLGTHRFLVLLELINGFLSISDSPFCCGLWLLIKPVLQASAEWNWAQVSTPNVPVALDILFLSSAHWTPAS